MLHFKKFVDQWWDEFGELKPLHAMNKIRLPWIRESLVTCNKMEDPSLPLKGYTILDVGCGGRQEIVKRFSGIILYMYNLVI